MLNYRNRILYIFQALKMKLPAYKAGLARHIPVNTVISWQFSISIAILKTCALQAKGLSAAPTGIQRPFRGHGLNEGRCPHLFKIFCSTYCNIFSLRKKSYRIFWFSGFRPWDGYFFLCPFRLCPGIVLLFQRQCGYPIILYGKICQDCASLFSGINYRCSMYFRL